MGRDRQDEGAGCSGRQRLRRPQGLQQSQWDHPHACPGPHSDKPAVLPPQVPQAATASLLSTSSLLVWALFPRAQGAANLLPWCPWLRLGIRWPWDLVPAPLKVVLVSTPRINGHSALIAVSTGSGLRAVPGPGASCLSFLQKPYWLPSPSQHPGSPFLLLKSCCWNTCAGGFSWRDPAAYTAPAQPQATA